VHSRALEMKSLMTLLSMLIESSSVF
jgi:hypothetical protein